MTTQQTVKSGDANAVNAAQPEAVDNKMERVRVPGGWIYRTLNDLGGMVFVPDAEEK